MCVMIEGQRELHVIDQFKISQSKVKKNKPTNNLSFYMELQAVVSCISVLITELKQQKAQLCHICYNKQLFIRAQRRNIHLLLQQNESSTY